MDEIYCVKIAQSLLRTAPVYAVPFDRMYFMDSKHKKLISRMFRYSLVLPLNDSLTTTLAYVHLSGTRKITKYRNDAAITGPETPDTKHIDTSKISTDSTLVVIPTYVHSVEFNKKTVSRLRYVTSNAVKRFARTSERITVEKITADIQLYTPTKIIPNPCLTCQNILEHYAGNCVYGSAECGTILLPYDNNFASTARKSLDAFGGK